MKRKVMFTGFVVFCFLIGIIPLSHCTSNENSSMLYVGGTGPDNYISIQNAIDNASDGDTIYVYSGIYYDSPVVDKSIDLIGEDRDSTILDGNGSGNVIALTTGNVNISGFTFRNSGVPHVDNASSVGDNTSINITEGSSEGDFVGGDNNTSPFDENIIFAGVYIESDFNLISSCTVVDCHIGVVIRKSSTCVIENCQVYNNGGGMTLYQSSNNQILNCKVFSNDNGVSLYQTNSTSIQNCDISSIEGVGIAMSESSYSIVHDNIFSNDSFGITLMNKCQGNVFFNNNFLVNKVKNVNDYCNNSWDNGIIGNYWDDYSGHDSDGDGIGDQQYFIPMISKDRYPQMAPVEITVFTLITININYPKHKDIINGSINVKGNVACEKDIESVKMRIDNGEWYLADGIVNWQIILDTTLYENGFHDVYIYVTTKDDDSSLQHIKIYVENAEDWDHVDTPGFELFIVLGVLILIVFMGKKVMQ